MRPIVTDRVAWSVCLSVTVVNPAKAAEPIEMPFVLRTLMGLGNHVLNGCPDPPSEAAILRGEAASHCKVYGESAVICAKRLNRSRCRSGCGLAWAQEIMC